MVAFVCGLVLQATVPGITQDLSTESALLNDFTTWQSPLIVPRQTGGEIEVRVPPDLGSWGIGRTFPVTAGKRYLVRAEVLVEPGASAYLLAHGAGLEWSAMSNTPPDSGAWTPISFVFDNTRDVTTDSVDVQLYAVHGLAKEASVHVRGFVVSELQGDYSLYVRFTAAAPCSVAAPYVITRGGPAFYASLDATALDAGSPSPWINLSQSLPADGLTIGFIFSDDNAERVRNLSVRVEAAYAPEDAAVFFNQMLQDSTGAIGVITEGRLPAPLDLESSFVLAKDLLRADPDAFRSRAGYAPARQPAHFNVTTTIGWWDGWGERSAFYPLLSFMHDLGINGLGDYHPEGVEADILEDQGISRRYYHFPVPTKWLVDDGSFDDSEIDQGIDFNYTNDPVLQRLLKTQPDKGRGVLIDMGDEANGLRFSGPSYTAAFRTYLAQQSVSAADLGLASLDAATPLNNMDSGQVDSVRPAPGDAAAGRLFYWRMRFWDEATGYVFGRVASRVRAESGESTPLVAPQMGTPFGGYLSSRVGLTLPTMARHGAANGFWGEAFLGWNDWCMGQQISTFADWLDGYARVLGWSRRAAYLHANRGRAPRKAVALAARGLTHLDYYTYGPYQLTTGDGVAGFGPLSEWSLRNIHDANDALAAVDDSLFSAERVRGGVAMLAAHSDPMWWPAATDTVANTGALSSDEAGLHVALNHGHHAVTFLPEEFLPERLDKETRVLFVHRQHVSDAAFAAIVKWVEAGGTLVTVGAAPTHDQYGQPVSARAAWLGATFAPIELSPSVNYTVNWDGLAPIESGRPRRQIIPAAEAHLIAAYGDGGVAAYDVARGAGRVRVVAFTLGLAYQDLSPACSDYALPGRLGSYPTGYVPQVRAAILQSASEADALRPAFADEPLVEVVRVKTAGGGAVALINYTNAPRDVQLTVPGVDTFKVHVAEFEVVRWSDPKPLLPTGITAMDPAPAPAEDLQEVAAGEESYKRRGCAATGTSGWCPLILGLAIGARRRNLSRDVARMLAGSRCTCRLFG